MSAMLTAGTTMTENQPNTREPKNPHEIEIVDYVTLTDVQQRRRRARSRAIALTLGALCLLFYIVTIVKLGPGVVLNRPM